MVWRYLRAIRRMRATYYDVAIDPTPESLWWGKSPACDPFTAHRDRSRCRGDVQRPSAQDRRSWGRRSHICFFAHGAGTKPLPRHWWIRFWQAFLQLEPTAIPLEFLPVGSATPTDDRLATLHLKSVRDLAAAIESTRMFSKPWLRCRLTNWRRATAEPG